MRMRAAMTIGLLPLALVATGCKSSSKAASSTPAATTSAAALAAAPSGVGSAGAAGSAGAGGSASAGPAGAATSVAPAESAAASAPTPSAVASVATSSTPTAAPAAGGSGNACSYASLAQVSSTTGQHYTVEQSSSIATGQDQCQYTSADGQYTVTVIVYQPNSGVTFATLMTVNGIAGATNPVSGVGDQAIIGQIELDAQFGAKLIAIQGAGGTIDGHTADAVALAKIIGAAL